MSELYRVQPVELVPSQPYSMLSRVLCNQLLKSLSFAMPVQTSIKTFLLIFTIYSSFKDKVCVFED